VRETELDGLNSAPSLVSLASRKRPMQLGAARG
jgi:hypothetical protein